jgi:hypothetical protein
LEIATENKRAEIIALMKKIGKLKEEQNSKQTQEETDEKNIQDKITKLNDDIAEHSDLMGKTQKVTIEMYRFLLDRTLTEGRQEATFRENLDFEIVPI